MKNAHAVPKWDLRLYQHRVTVAADRTAGTQLGPLRGASWHPLYNTSRVVGDSQWRSRRLGRIIAWPATSTTTVGDPTLYAHSNAAPSGEPAISALKIWAVSSRALRALRHAITSSAHGRRSRGSRVGRVWELSTHDARGQRQTRRNVALERAVRDSATSRSVVTHLANRRRLASHLRAVPPRWDLPPQTCGAAAGAARHCSTPPTTIKEAPAKANPRLHAFNKPSVRL